MSGCLLSVNAKEPGCTRDASERALGVERGLLDLHPYWHLTTQQKALWKLPDHALRSNLLLLGASLCVRASAAVPLPVAVRPPSLLPVIFGKWVCRVLLSLGKRLLRRSPRLPTAASRWLWWRWGGMTTGTRRQSAKEPPSNARARVCVRVSVCVCILLYPSVEHAVFAVSPNAPEKNKLPSLQSNPLKKCNVSNTTPRWLYSHSSQLWHVEQFPTIFYISQLWVQLNWTAAAWVQPIGYLTGTLIHELRLFPWLDLD